MFNEKPATAGSSRNEANRVPTPIDYVARGWALVPFARGLKGPEGLGYSGWNRRERCVTDPNEAAKLIEQIGLAHAYSGTCAIDLDDLDGAIAWFAPQGVDVRALLAADDAVMISSGRPNRAKLLYKLATPLPSKKISAPSDRTHTLVEFRCGTHKGTTVQDVLPPSIHPDTGRPYEWVTGIAGDWRDLPELPAHVRALWTKLVARPEKTEVPRPQGASADKLRELLARHNPDATYDDWAEVGMALHHETAGEEWGLALWDEWSSTGSKYIGIDDLESHWRSFGNHDRPLTIASLRKDLIASADDFDIVSQVAPAGLAVANVTVVPALAGSVAANEAAARSGFVSWTDFRNGPDMQWHVHEVLPKAELAVVYGESGSGKTFFALDLVAAVARGVQWRERDTERGQALYIVAEGAAGFRKRLRAYEHQHNVHSLDEMALKVYGNAPNLFDRDQALRVAALAREAGGASVIVIDTLSAVAVGANENSGEDMNQIIAHCKGLNRATGALVILIHHSGKDAARGARGWSGIRAAVDAEIEITKTPGEVRIATVTKMKDGEDGVAFGFQLMPLVLGVDAKGNDITSMVVVPAELQRTDGSKSKRRRLSGLPKLVLDTAKDCLPIDGGKGSVAALVARCAERMPKGEGKDRRPEDVKRALTKSLCGEFIEVEGDSYRVL